MTGRRSHLVYAGDPRRVVGRVSAGAYGTGLFTVTAIVPDPWDGERGPRMGYADDGPAVFRGGYASTFEDAVNLVTRETVGRVGADANVSLVVDHGY